MKEDILKRINIHVDLYSVWSTKTPNTNDYERLIEFYKDQWVTKEVLRWLKQFQVRIIDKNTDNEILELLEDYRIYILNKIVNYIQIYKEEESEFLKEIYNIFDVILSDLNMKFIR